MKTFLSHIKTFTSHPWYMMQKKVQFLIISTVSSQFRKSTYSLGEYLSGAVIRF